MDHDSSAPPERTARSRVFSPSALDGHEFVSQREFSPTPYEATMWEIVGERARDRDFTPMEVSIIRDAESAADPMFDVFDAGLSGGDEETFVISRGAVGRGSEVTAEELAEFAEQQRLALESEWLARIEAAKTEAYAAGVAATQVKIVENYEKLSSKLSGIIESIQGEWLGLSERLEQEALKFALQLSQKLVPIVAEIKPDYILDIIREGLKQLGAAKPVKIRLSADDYEFLTVIGLPVEISTEELGVTYVSDETIRSGCIVETNYGELDLQLEPMWERLRASVEEAFRL